MNTIKMLKKKVFSNQLLTKEDALLLQDVPLDELCKTADEIRMHFCKDAFDICTIINGKNGKCSEDCKYCAQSTHYQTDSLDSYPLLGTKELVHQAKHNASQGVLRYSIVTSGKQLSKNEVDRVCQSIKAIKKEVDIEVCVSFGLLDKEQFVKLKEAGATRVHCNLESSERFFPQICTTHTWQDKIQTLKAAKSAGLSICSGGIMGLGESMQDRIDMILAIRALGVRSVPVNILNPIKGTPYESNEILTNEELCRIVAIFRFLIPDACIRMAGGRGLLADKGAKCFQSGANAEISGDMLTTTGYTISNDIKMVEKLGYEVRLSDE